MPTSETHRRRGRIQLGISLLSAIALLMAFSPVASAQRPGHVLTGAVASPCAPLSVFPPPPPGFAPGSASATDLQTYGFPPRPAAGPDAGAAMTAWQTAVNAAQHYEVPQPICTSVTHTAYTGIWAGYVAPRANYSDAAFTWSESQWVQPSVPANSNYTNWQDAPTASFWDGIGVTSLIQAGVDSISMNTPQYRYWTEDYPNGSIYEGPAISPGQSAYVYLQYQGNQTTYYYLENVTTGHYQTFTNASPYVGSNAANFINERLGGHGLPKFGTANVSQSYFGAAQTTHQLVSTKSTKYVMTSNCTSTGTVLSSPSSMDSYGNFTQTWKNSSPYSDAC